MKLEKMVALSKTKEYIKWKKGYDVLHKAVDDAHNHWHDIMDAWAEKGHKKSSIGLTPDFVKKAPDFIEAKNAYWKAHNAVRAFAGSSDKKFLRTVAMLRRAKKMGN